jgi:hypothetical protein
VKKPKSARASRRQAERAREKLAKQRMALAALEPGGVPERPLEVDSASVIESRAETFECLHCGGRVRSLDHRAEVVGERRLRVAVVRCASCGAERTIYFKLGTVLPS